MRHAMVCRGGVAKADKDVDPQKWHVVLQSVFKKSLRNIRACGETDPPKRQTFAFCFKKSLECGPLFAIPLRALFCCP